jgi:hypothetical protein
LPALQPLTFLPWLLSCLATPGHLSSLATPKPLINPCVRISRHEFAFDTTKLSWSAKYSYQEQSLTPKGVTGLQAKQALSVLLVDESRNGFMVRLSELPLAAAGDPESIAEYKQRADDAKWLGFQHGRFATAFGAPRSWAQLSPPPVAPEVSIGKVKMDKSGPGGGQPDGRFEAHRDPMTMTEVADAQVDFNWKGPGMRSASRCICLTCSGSHAISHAISCLARQPPPPHTSFSPSRATASLATGLCGWPRPRRRRRAVRGGSR